MMKTGAVKNFDKLDFGGQYVLLEYVLVNSLSFAVVFVVF